ncbi:helix-turn-helix domain-containing protein [Gemelliphila palaticanis]|uniref:Helix-turn-helix transcriptional regulator n=1 Tax=Gemelliphila palaticanis TaxID=81950 RepID=A0ABX2SWQ3_9BACL|nr:helix-turn-helix transcriptional regulator [Gemella palaticanis]MBF0714666.1 helix-turn-helix transcriptional regulator [Gemella palaticanis]NYS46596.1 helix-turn-helix transcriptional regulator [Gemella palaticanis]
MKINIDKKAVGLRIKQLRLNKGYTLEEFGKLFGASKGNIQQWENGKSLPNKDRIKRISKLADITVNELLYGSVEEFVKNNYDDIVNKEFGSVAESILLTVNARTFSRYLSIVKDKHNLNIDSINDLDNFTNEIWDIINEYLMKWNKGEKFEEFSKNIVFEHYDKLLTFSEKSSLIYKSKNFLEEIIKTENLPNQDINIIQQTIKMIDKATDILIKNKLEVTEIPKDVEKKIINNN